MKYEKQVGIMQSIKRVMPYMAMKPSCSLSAMLPQVVSRKLNKVMVILGMLKAACAALVDRLGYACA